MREEISQETQADQAGQDEQNSRHQRQNPGIGHILGGGRDRQAGQTACHNGGGRRIGPNHQVARRAKKRKQHHGDQEGIQAGSQRHARNPGVAHHLRNSQRSQCDPGNQIGRELGQVEGEDSLKKT